MAASQLPTGAAPPDCAGTRDYASTLGVTDVWRMLEDAASSARSNGL